jgi:LAS superfamily LD-carboxypeptidase LdcB
MYSYLINPKKKLPRVVFSLGTFCYNAAMKSHRHIIAFFVACIIIGSAVGFGLAWYSHKKTDPRPLSEKIAQIIPTPTPVKNPSARIVFVGDLMVDRGVENSVKNNLGGDFGRLFEHLPLFKEVDGVFLNLEGPVTTKGPNVGSRFSFAMDEKILPALAENNIKMVSFANNHVGDRSNTGFTSTLSNLDKYTIPYTGAGKNKAEASTVKTFTANGLVIGFIGCSDVGPDWLKATDTAAGQILCSDPSLATYISQARESVDFLVFSAHWGVEYNPRTTRQKTLAYAAVDAGADMVIGHHPHVVQETEYYKDKFIAYSLGNFIFDQYFSDATMQGLLVDAEIEQHSIKSISLKIIELDKTGNKYQPKEIRDATDADFLKKGVVAAQTCPAAKDATTDKWLEPVGPDMDIGNYIPKNLIPLNNRINVQTSASCLTETTANALITMEQDMADQGLKIIMTSGFRSRNTQETIHDSSTTTLEAANDPTKYPSVAKPGRSEHQLGTALDMKSGSDPAFSYDNFKNSAEYAWLTANAYKYGFIQSYTIGTESITGYIPESWHWRYVGIDHAKAIREQGITTYEYLKALKKKSQ